MLGGRSPLEDPLGKLDSLSIPGKLPPSVEDQLSALRGRLRATYIDQLWLRVEAVLAACRRWKVRVLLFPEYSIPWELLPRVAEAAGDIVVVAGTHMVDQAARKSKVYESLGSTPEMAVRLGQAVAPVLHGGHLIALHPKLQTSRFEGDNLTLGKAWAPVFLPPTISGPMGVLICIDFLSREAGAHRELVAERLAQCRFLAVPSLTPASSTVEFAAKAWEEARRYGRPVLYANDAERGGTSIFVDEGQETDLRDFPRRAGYLEAGDEGVIVADVDLGFERPGPSTRYDHEPAVKPFACATLLGSWHPVSVKYASWLDEMEALLGADDDIEPAVEAIERARETLLDAGALPGNAARDARLRRLLRDLRNVTNAETLWRFTREVRLPANSLPPAALRAALASGAADAVFEILKDAHASELAPVEKAMREAAKAVLSPPAGAWTLEAAEAARVVAKAVRGTKPAPAEEPHEISVPALPRSVSPSALGECVVDGLELVFGGRPSELVVRIDRGATRAEDLEFRELVRLAAFGVTADIPYLLALAEGSDAASVAAFPEGESSWSQFVLHRPHLADARWRLVPVGASANHLAPRVRTAVQKLGLAADIDETFEGTTPGRIEVLSSRFRGAEVIRSERERRLNDVGGHFIEPAVLVGDSATPSDALEALDDWLASSHQLALVLGEFGSGKSTLLIEWAKTQNERNDGAVLRVAYCNLAGAGSGATALGLVLAACELEDTPANRAAAELLIQLGGLVPCFDGFDEMATRASPGELAGRLSELFSVARGGGQVIVSSRDNYFPSDEALRNTVSEALRSALGEPASYRRISLLPFDNARIERLVRAICGNSSAAESALLRISSIYDLSDLVHKPLLLGMVVKSIKLIDPNARVARADVYEAYLARWLQNTHCTGLEQEVFTDEQKETFTESLAEQLWRSSEPSLTWEELSESVRARLAGSLPPTSTLFDAFYEVSGGTFFVRDPATNRYRFAHKSFLEFFLARTLIRTLPERPAEALTTNPLTPEVAMFAGEILRRKGDPKEAPAIRSLQGWLSAGRPETDIDGTAKAAGNALRLLNGLARWAKDGAAWIPDGADLRRIAIPGEDLKGARLRSARLNGALLSGCDLSGADLSGAGLSGAQFVAARLDHAGLRGATALRANFTRAEATGCSLTGADLRQADLSASVWLDSLWEDARLDGAIVSGLVAPGAGSGSLPQLDLLPPSVRIAAELGHSAPVKCVAFSPDGIRIASGSDDETVRLWDAATGKEISSLSGHSSSVSSVAFSPDGTRIASGSWDNTVRLWDAATGQEIRKLKGHRSLVSSVAFSPDGTRIASGSHDKTVRLWDAATGKEIRSLSGHSAYVSSVAFNPDGNRLASGSWDKTVRLWDAATGKEIRSLSGHSSSVSSVAFSPDGTRIAFGSEGNAVRLLDAATGKEIRLLFGHLEGVTCVAFSPDGSRVTSGSEDNTVRVWDAASGNQIRWHSALGVNSVAFSPEGTRIAFGTINNTVRLWEPTTGKEIRSFPGRSAAVCSVAFSPDGTRIASGSDDRTMRLWDATTGKEIRSLFQGRSALVRSVAFSPDGTRIASGSWDTTVCLWDAATGKEIRTLSGHSSLVDAVAFSPDGTRLASGSWDKTVRLWDAATGKEIRTLSGHSGTVSSVAFSPDGTCIASGSEDNTVRLWDAVTGKEIRSLSGHSSSVSSLAFSPDGTCIASGSEDNTVRLWDAVTGKEIRSLSGHSAHVSSVAFSPDGTRIASGSWDNTVRLWDAATGKEIRSLSGHSASVYSVAFSPDGTRIASGSRDNTVRLWDTATGKEVASIHVDPWLVSLRAGAVSLDKTQAGRFRLEATSPSSSGSRATHCLPLPAAILEVFHRDDLVARSLAGEEISPEEFRPGLAKLGISGGKPWDGELWRVPESPKVLEPMVEPPEEPQSPGPNPFHPGPALIGVANPAGRDRELKQLTGLVESRIPAAILGPRRSGKTTLLHALAHRTRDGRARYLTLEGKTIRTRDALALLIEPALEGQKNPTGAFEALLAKQDSPLLLLDEVASLREADPSVFAWLRALGQQHAAVVFSGSEWDWTQLAAQAAKAAGSSFGNDVRVLTLGPLEESAAIGFLERSAPSDVPLKREGTASWIVELCGGWPFYLQVMGFTVVEEVRLGSRRPLVDRGEISTLYRSRLLQEWRVAFTNRFTELPERARALLREAANAPELPEYRSYSLSESKLLADTGLIALEKGWLRDRPFFDWIRSNVGAEHSEHAAMPKDGEEVSPLAPPTKEGYVIGEHRLVIETALRRLDYLPAGVRLPEPYRIASGVAGKSAVYFFSLARHGSMVNLVIKLDEPERAVREWKVVQELLRLNTPPSAMLPVHGNSEEDGVIIFKDAGAITSGVRTLQIGELLRQQITSNPEQCVDGLNRAWDALDVFYRGEPGAVRPSSQDQPLRWDRAFPRIRNRLSEISQHASDNWPSVKVLLSSQNREFPDPADGLGDRVADLTGRVMLSRVHGDLNLQNILVSVDGSTRPVAALIIDLANSEPSVPTAIDFSRLESELWHEIFVGDKTDANGDGLLAAFLIARDCLEGRQANLPPGGAGTAAHYLRVVVAIREHAAQLLRGNLPGYLLEDYLTALYFQHMQALSYPSVNKHPLKTRLALLGAAASLQFLEDLHAGRYAEKALNRLASPLRTYAEMTALPPSVPPSPAQQSVSPPAAPKYSINIGKAKNVVIGDSDREKG